MSFEGLYISASGIYANKKSLDTVSHNISNANNPDYVRQRAIHASSLYTQNTDGRYKMGTGVDVQEIRQLRDEFLDIKYREESETFGYWKASGEILGEIEMIFNEVTNSGLQKVMDDFWNAWSEAYKEPDSLTIRGLLHENAVAFTETVNHMSTQLDNLQFNLNKDILNKVEEVNTILKNISGLNKNIKMAEGYGKNIVANDFRDKRNAMLDRLSTLIPIKTYEKSTGEAVVSLNGRDIVNGEDINLIKVEQNKKGFGTIHWSDTGEPIDLKGKGELGGFIDCRDKEVENYRNKLDTLVRTIAEKINGIHMGGKDLQGKDGLAFFVSSGTNGDINASNIRVNPELSNFNKIALSKSGDLGDGEIAKKILALRKEVNKKEKDANGKPLVYNMTFDDYYRDLVSSLGVDGNMAKNIALNQEVLLKQIDDRKGAISNVSLDEEMASMLQFQHSYVANSRVMNAIDEMIDNIVNRMGIVGR